MEKTEIIWREPWKKKEPQNRLTEKEKAGLEKSMAERATMEKRNSQVVKVFFYDTVFGLPDLFRTVKLEFKIPLRKEEIEEIFTTAGFKLQSEGS